MEEVKGLFIGYKTFVAKSGKKCYVLSYLFISLDEVNNRATYFVKDVFSSEDTYNKFIASYELLSEVTLKREILRRYSSLLYLS